MSTWLDIRCVDCGVDCGLSYTRDSSLTRPLFAALVLAAPEVAALAQKLPSAAVQLEWMGPVVPCSFFVEHAGHRLAVVNGYGDVLR